MSGSAIKVSRREIRRAFGTQAVGTLEAQGVALTELLTFAQDAKREIDGLYLLSQHRADEIARLRELFAARDARTWRARFEARVARVRELIAHG